MHFGHEFPPLLPLPLELPPPLLPLPPELLPPPVPVALGVMLTDVQAVVGVGFAVGRAAAWGYALLIITMSSMYRMPEPGAW